MEIEKANELIEKIEMSKTSIEALEKEAIAFANAKGELFELSKTIRGMLSILNDMVSSTDQLRTELAKLTIENTLSQFNSMINSMKSHIESLNEANNNAIKEIALENQKNLENIKHNIDTYQNKSRKVNFISMGVLGGVSLLLGIIALIIAV